MRLEFLTGSVAQSLPALKLTGKAADTAFNVVIDLVQKRPQRIWEIRLKQVFRRPYGADIKELIESTHKIDTLAGNLQGIDKSLETYQNVLHDTNELYQQQADVLKQQADEKAAGYSKAKKQVKEAQKKVQ